MTRITCILGFFILYYISLISLLSLFLMRFLSHYKQVDNTWNQFSRSGAKKNYSSSFPNQLSGRLSFLQLEGTH
jgi:hypothetical protein